MDMATRPSDSTVHRDDSAAQSIDWMHNQLLQQGRLYDRTEQEQELFQAYERIAADESSSSSSSSSDCEIVLVSGASGTGKTALARSLHPRIKDHGYFVSGKFDQLANPEPYAPMVTAFTEFSHLVCVRSEQEEMAKSIRDAVGTEWSILVEMIPAMKQVLGDVSSGEEKSNVQGLEAQNRFNFVFRMFVKAISSKERPLVMFFDDMQWAQASSLDMLRSVCMEGDAEGLLILMAYRDNDITPAHPFAVLLEEVSVKVPLTKIEVSNFQCATVNDMMADVLKLPQNYTKPLADVVWQQTDGNVFFVIQLLLALADKGLLYMDVQEQRWSWDQDHLLSVIVSTNVVELLVEKMNRLPTTCQEILKVAACIGAEFSISTVALVVSDLDGSSLQRIESEGLVHLDKVHGEHKFVHDKIQQAAYTLIDNDEKSLFHLDLGRHLLSQMSPSKLEDSIFIVVKQLNIASHLISDAKERSQAAALNLRAGQKAMLLSAFKHAAMYIRYGISLLGDDRWTDQYNLSLSLHNAAAEAEYCNGKFDKVETMVQEVLDNARSFRDKIRAYSNKVYALGTQGRPTEALDLGIKVLGKLGESFPSSSRRCYVMIEYYKTRNMLRGKTNEYLLSLPRMRNPDKLAAMQLLKLIAIYAYMGRADFFPLAVFRMVQLSLRHGISAVSTDAFGKYALLLCGTMQKFGEGYRYGQLALAILNRFQAKEWIARTYTLVYGCTNHWTQPLRANLDQLKYAHSVGMETGDIEYSANVICLYCFHCLEAGRALDENSREAETYLDQMILFKQHAWVAMTRPLCQAYDCLRGLADDPSSLTGKFMDQDAAIQSATDAGFSLELVFINYLALLLACLFHDFETAAQMAKRSRNVSNESTGTFMAVNHAFFEGLAALSLAGKTPNPKPHMNLARSSLKRLKLWSKHSPQNGMQKVMLIKAEFSALTAKDQDAALSMYRIAAETAKKNGFIQDEALANERTGLFLLKHEDPSTARAYFERAHSLYFEWGANAKADHVERQLAEME